MAILGQFRIQTVTMAAVAAIGGTALVCGMSSLLFIDGIGHRLEASADDTVPSLMLLSGIDEGTSRARLALVEQLRPSRDMRKGDADAALSARIADVDARIVRYRPLVSDAGERRLFARLNAAWGQWKRVAAEVRLELRAGRRDEADAIYERSARAGGEALDLALRAQLDFNRARGEADGAAGKAEVRRAFVWILALGAAILIGVGAVLVLLTNRLALPLRRLTDAMGDMAGGNLDRDIPGEEQADEIGDIAAALRGIKHGVAARSRAATETQAATQRHVVEALARGLGLLKAGRLDCTIAQAFPAEYERLRIDFNDTTQTLAQVIGDVAEAAQSVSNGSSEIAVAAGDLAERTSSQAASLEETAASVRHVSQAIGETATVAEDARRNAQDTEREAVQGGEIMRGAAQAMEKIQLSSRKMEEIVSLIDGIAFQTNLLALNAGVEAARAGDAGKGFAVVATEVRTLAERSAQAAKDITGIIRTSAADVSNGVDMMRRTQESLERIVGRTGALSAMIGTIAGSAQDQAAAIRQVEAVVAQMDTGTQQNAALVEESTAAARGLVGEADRMGALVGRFSGGDGEPPRRAATSRFEQREPPLPPLPPPPSSMRVSTVLPPPRQKRAMTGNAVPAEDDWSEF
ncbi:methyl-accepting chemotaxis protein [Novosphingobium sp. ZW T3_23]|uniref:methyl-accepting chemotaxis protein n=1 Tax=Novosphingobium sp. ZW T3_23 TaxID=3378084 RepID=UPI00385323FA